MSMHAHDKKWTILSIISLDALLLILDVNFRTLCIFNNIDSYVLCCFKPTVAV